MVGYIKESYNELVHKVAWPAWNNLQSSALLVMVASLIFSLVIFGMDSVFHRVMEAAYKMLY